MTDAVATLKSQFVILIFYEINSDKRVIINKLDLEMPIGQLLDIGNSEVLRCKNNKLFNIFIKTDKKIYLFIVFYGQTHSQRNRPR